MPIDIKLSSAIRSNLLALQNTANLVSRTQNRLSTGQKVSSAIDDAVAFFQAKSLSDRAGDLTAKKDGIDQGISTLTVALQAVESAEKVFQQMKGVLLSAKAGSAEDRATLADQFSTLAQQSNFLVEDASYQGLNMLSSSTAELKVSFSEKSTSVLSVDAVNLHFSAFTGLAFDASVAASGVVGDDWSAVSANISLFEAAIDVLDSAIATIRTNAATLGSNVSLLKTRLDFTTNYVNTLTVGSDKLTLADLNEEGANLVALQTRQQLATQALAFAGQSEQAVLQLFQ